MALIEFEDLPSTSTPINAENLNNNFNELNSTKISSRFINDISFNSLGSSAYGTGIFSILSNGNEPSDPNAHYYVIQIYSNDDYIYQEATLLYSNEKFRRIKSNGVWQNWISSSGNVLYSGLSGSAITLSETTANYNCIDILYGQGNGSQYGMESIRVYSPNGKKINLTQAIYLSSNNRLQIATKTVEISGDRIANVSNSSCYANITSSTSVTSGNVINIYKVVGYK